jgi:hypothetical protein
MADLATQLRDYLEATTPEVSLSEVPGVRMVRPLPRQGPTPTRRWLLVGAAAAAALAAVIAAVLLWPSSPSEPAPFIDEGTTAVTPGSTAGTVTPIPSAAPAAAFPSIVADSVSADETLSLSSGSGPLVAVSAHEVWTFEADLIGRLEDGVWAYWRLTGPDWWLQTRPEGHWVQGLAAAPDATVWAATDAGLFSYDAQQWSRRRGGPTAGVTVDEEGTVWVGGPGASWVSRWDGEKRAGRAGGESGYWGGIEMPCGGIAMATLPGGEVWTSGGCAWADVHLYRYDGTSLEPVVIEGFQEPALTVIDLEAAPNGDLWLWGTPTGWGNWWSQVILARLHGGAWTLYEWPFEGPSIQWDGGSPFGGLAVAADGVVWVASGDGLRTFDGTEWTQRLQGQPIYTVDVAPDGTVWYSDGEGVHALTGQ